MKFNESSKLFYSNVYIYDISSCHYRIAEKLGIDLSKIDKENKEKRNIQIGLMLRNNPKLTSIFRKTTESIIDEYLLRNEINNNDIIIRQYDGFITTKILKITNLTIPIDLKHILQNMIISIKMDSYISSTTKNITIVKGISNQYDEINKIFEKIVRINYLNKHAIFDSLQKIKDDLLSNEEVRFYCIPTNDKKHFNIYVKQYGEMEISESTINIIDPNDIDRIKYYRYYIEPFTKSIISTFI